MNLPTLSGILEPSGAPLGGRLATRSGSVWETSEGALPDARKLAAALLGYGLAEGAPVAVLGEEGRATLTAQLAVLAAGGTLVPLDPTAEDGGLRDAMHRIGAVHAIASNERQLSRVLSWRPDLPALELVLLMEARPSERRPAALLAHEAVEAGAAHLAAEPGLLRAALGRGGERAPAVIFPDAAGDKPISRADLTALAGRIAGTLGIEGTGVLLAALPVTALARLSAALAALARGATLALAAAGEPLDAGLDALRPTCALCASDAVARLRGTWGTAIDGKGIGARALTRWALRRGADAGRHRFLHRVADVVVLERLRRRLGGRLRAIHSVGSPLHPEIGAFFGSIGIPVRSFGMRMAR